MVGDGAYRIQFDAAQDGIHLRASRRRLFLRSSEGMLS